MRNIIRLYTTGKENGTTGIHTVVQYTIIHLIKKISAYTQQEKKMELREYIRWYKTI